MHFSKAFYLERFDGTTKFFENIVGLISNFCLKTT